MLVWQVANLPHLKPPRTPHVVEIAQVVADADVVEHAAEAAQGDAHAVGAAEAAELAASFDVRLQVEEHAGNAALLQLLFDASGSGP